MKSNTISPQPQVTVKLIGAPDPKIEAFMTDFKEIVIVDGCMTIPEYLELRDRHEMTDEQLLPLLQEAGYGFVKTAAVNAELEQQVIVDLRYMAAAMLLIYSDPKFALTHSVLECIKTFYNYGSWGGAPCVSNTLLEDTYSAYGHHFSYMAMADNADLSDEVQREQARAGSPQMGHSEMIARNLPALNELIKNEVELTAVFRLCFDTMYNVNSGQAGKLYRTFHGESKAYNYFWRMACKLRDNARGKLKQKQAAHKCDELCTHH